jgi:hypothetical protein
MELADFLREIQADVRSRLAAGPAGTGGDGGDGALFPEIAFCETVMEHMAEVGMTSEPTLCHFQAKIGNANLHLSGYSLNEDLDELDLFVSLYEGVDAPTPVSDTEVKGSAEQCLRFLSLCAEGKMAGKLDPTSDARSLASTIQEIYGKLEQIRVFVLTDKIAKAKHFKSREIARKTVRLEVMDVERLFRHWSEGKPRDELVVNFIQLSGGPLPCVYVPGQTDDYDYALAAVPGEALRVLYEKFGARLLEANVRSFLSVKAKGVNAGIQKTLREAPERFMAYNNGVVLVADEAHFQTTADGSPGIAWLKGMQIVNGGQTTASMYFTKKRFPETDLATVRVPAKIIVMKVQDEVKEEALVSDISRFANSQNSVKQSDLSANKPFHIDIERLSLTVYLPDGTGRWFYERAAGSYTTMLAREGTTPAKLRLLRDTIPPARRITKTDLAKYLMAWDGYPDVVSLGAQKCFDKFMNVINSETPSLDAAGFKAMVAKAILFKAAQKRIRPMFAAYQANVTAYTVSLTAKMFDQRLRIERIWNAQDVSEQMTDQISSWAKEINDELHRTASGRMISEWGKKPECREAILSARYSDCRGDIPELM